MSNFTPDKRPIRPDISLTEATVNGYGFIKDNFDKLLKWAVIPIVLNFFTYFIIDWQDPGADHLKSFLYTLPGVAAFAWYVFVQTRLQVLGEDLGNLPGDEDFQMRRRDDAVLSVGCYVLFQMTMALIAFALSGTMDFEPGDTIETATMVRMFLGLMLIFWLLKYGVLHLIAAVDGDIRDYLSRVQGAWFSFVIVGAGFVSTLPVLLLFMFLLGFVAPDAANGNVENSGRFAMYALGTVMSWSVITVLNATLVDTLRQLYEGKKP